MIPIEVPNKISLETELGCFGDLEPDDILQLTEQKTQVVYNQSELIIKQGAFSRYIFFVLEGLVRIFLDHDGKKQINIRVALQGDFTAFGSIFNVKHYQYSATAITKVTVCMVDMEVMQTLFLTKPRFAYRIYGRDVAQHSLMYELVRNLSYRQMRGKLATALLYLGSEEFSREQIFSILSRQEIADFASITEESTVKFLKEFESEQIIRLDGKLIEILLPEKQQELSRIG